MANSFVIKHHYSGKVVKNSQLHLGVFYNYRLCGVMQFGPSINKKGTINLVAGTRWNGFIELNRMAFIDELPKNSESRAISIAIKLIKKNAPHIDWIVTFADATQCGTGTIYRAANFKLVEIRKNDSLRINPDTKKPLHIIQAHHLKINKQFYKWEKVPGYQIKYIYFLKPEKQQNLTVPVLPFSELDKIKYPEKVRHVYKNAPVV